MITHHRNIGITLKHIKTFLQKFNIEIKLGPFLSLEKDPEGLIRFCPFTTLALLLGRSMIIQRDF